MHRAGGQAFYQRLRSLTPEQRRRFQMMPVSFTNTLTGDEEKRRGDRVRGTFINSAMLVTLRGAVISDALDDGRVVSGVGGLHDFAVQAFALSDARFIVALNATRHSDGKPRSNIVWSYAHTTLPWNLRDIVVTEYGAADLRGKTDNEAIKALLGIADSRFQGELLSQAVSAGKVEPDWRIPERSRNNTPAALEAALRSGREAGILNRFPFGTEFSVVEQRLLGALGVIKQHAHSRLALAGLVWRGLRAPPPDEPVRQCLLRLQLGPARDRGVSIRDRLLTWLVLGALDRDSAPSSTSP